MRVEAKDPVVEFHDLTVSYHKKPVLWNIDMTLPQGALIGIIGPNGAGKSTLIKAAMGLLPLGSGYVRMFDQNLNDVRHKVSYVPQRESVDWDFPTSVLDVVLMGRYAKLGLLARPRKADKEMAMNCLRKVGMEDYINRQISQLSGGQQQRVFLARALAQEADLYFMDEPFAGVDPIAVEEIQTIVAQLKNKNIGILITDHNVNETLSITDRAYLMFEGKLLKAGTAEDLANDEQVRKVYLGKHFELKRKI